MKLHAKQKPTLKRTAWMSIGGVSIIALAGITASYVDARQRTEVSNQMAAQNAEISSELSELRAKQAAIKEKQEAEAKKQAAEKNTSDTSDNNQAASTTPVVVNTGAHLDPSRIDVIVNKKHPLNPRAYTPSLRNVGCAGYAGALINPVAANDFARLCSAAKSAGAPLAVSSSYRSYGEQVSTYNYWVSVSGKAGADTYSARPGYSEHQTGLSVDFMVPGGARLSDFTGTKQQKWLAKNAWKYGFLQRYTTANNSATGYTAESWHFRYVGTTVAKDYTARSASSLEQYWGVSGGGY